MTQNTILITGSTGTIGKELVKSLSNYTDIKITLRLLVRDEKKARELFQQYSPQVEIEYSVGDIEDVDRIFLLTLSSPKQEQVERNFVLEGLRRSANLKQVVRISGLGSSGDADTNSLFRFHNDAERALQKIIKKESKQASLVILRPNLFIQNFLRDDIHSIKTQGVFYRPKHDHGEPYSISHVDVRDIAQLSAQVLIEPVEKHAGQTYNITGPHSLHYHQVAGIISSVLGKEVKFKEVEEADYASSLQQFGFPSFLVIALVKLFQAYKLNGSTANVHGDFKIVTGNNARSLEDFFNENKNAFL